MPMRPAGPRGQLWVFGAVKIYEKCGQGQKHTDHHGGGCHGAKAPKWVWAGSPDHRSYGGGSPPI